MDDTNQDTHQTEVAPTPPAIDQHRFRFNGSAAEYFKIWIVNIALSILTLGIYSAWAKVRTRKYLYGNTEVAGARFDYHANPVKILKGRLLVAGLFLAYTLGGKISPAIGGVFLLIFWGLFPWIIVRALIFNLTNSSYRNVRFNFEQDYKASYVAYGKGALIWMFTLGLGAPYAVKLHTCFKLNRISFGSQRFSFDAPTEYFFKIFYAAFGIIFAGACVGGIALGITSVTSIAGGAGKGPVAVAAMIFAVLLYGGIFVSSAYIRARFGNLLANQTKIGAISLHSDLKVKDMTFLYITNLLGCAFTLGLAIPWAVVRTLRYRLEHTTVLASEGALESIVADVGSGSRSAAADAAVDFWDIDLGF